jgi:hypothetical protein
MTRMRAFGWWMVALLLLVPPLAGASAQDGGPQLVAGPEFSLGDACPITGVMNADGSAVWVLVYDCIGDYTASMQAFSVADGTLVGQSAGPFEMDIAGNNVFGFDRPIVLNDDGTLTADFLNWETGATASFGVDTATGAVTPVADSPRFLTADAIFAALPDFNGYTDFLTYSDDRALALTQDDTTLYVFDVVSGQEMMRLAPPGGVEYASIWFGPNGDQLYVSQMIEPGNYDNPEQTLYVFDIPTGELVSTTAVPHRIYSVSPDERLLVVSTPVMGGDNESLAVLELATGQMSESLPTRSTSINLSVCKNDGRDAPMPWTSDDPNLVEILWLPDSSGFVTLQSEEFNSGPNPCLTNDSRMRVYSVTD